MVVHQLPVQETCMAASLFISKSGRALAVLRLFDSIEIASEGRIALEASVYR
jgi:hypothetical protein